MINEETEAIDVLFPLEKACVCMAKKKTNKQYCFRPCNVFRKFCLFACPQQAFLLIFWGVFFTKKKKNNTLETLGRLNPDIWDGQIWMFGISDP
jgi:hypothetical protein